MDFRLSYAQNREDFLIAAFFPDVAAGHYVDVGAGHPEEHSVTKLLYDRGWSGINIEPIPELAAALRAQRPRDVTLQVALAATAGDAPFRQYSGWGLSTLSPDMVAEYESDPTPWTEEFTEYTVETITLASVLEEHPLPDLHVLKLDVEGAEYDVLAGADWERFRPDLVCIETNHIRRDWFPILHAAGYEQVFHDGLNAYLLAAEARHRAEHFDYAQVVHLDGPTIVTPAEAAELEAAGQLRIDIANLHHETSIARLEAQTEMDGLRAAIADRDATIADRDATIAELEATTTDLTHALAAERELAAMYAARDAEVTARLNAVEAHFAEIIGSQSWRYTYPIRRFFEILRARLPRRVLAFAWRRVRPAIQAARATPVGAGELSPEASAIRDRLRALADVEGPA